jgi:hypothetical protein
MFHMTVFSSVAINGIEKKQINSSWLAYAVWSISKKYEISNMGCRETVEEKIIGLQ